MKTIGGKPKCFYAANILIVFTILLIFYTHNTKSTMSRFITTDTTLRSNVLTAIFSSYYEVKEN